MHGRNTKAKRRVTRPETAGRTDGVVCWMLTQSKKLGLAHVRRDNATDASILLPSVTSFLAPVSEFHG